MTHHIAIIVGSTRTGRFADYPLNWLTETLAARPEIALDVIDLLAHPLPFYDLPKPPAMAARQYTTDAERGLGERIDAADGYIIIANEFNHGYSAELKNVLDHYFAEFSHKPVAFVGYGNVGGSRAIEQLRQVVAELDMVSVKHSVHLMGPDMMAIRQGSTAPFETLLPRLEMMMTNLEWWTAATKAARD